MEPQEKKHRNAASDSGTAQEITTTSASTWYRWGLCLEAEEDTPKQAERRKEQLFFSFFCRDGKGKTSVEKNAAGMWPTRRPADSGWSADGRSSFTTPSAQEMDRYHALLFSMLEIRNVKSSSDRVNVRGFEKKRRVEATHVFIRKTLRQRTRIILLPMTLTSGMQNIFTNVFIRVPIGI